MRLREKVEALFAAGVQRVLCLRFNRALRNLTAREFVQQLLVEGLGIKHLVVGDDFRFGCDRIGDFSLLCRSEEHTSELQSRGHLVCRLLLEKKNENISLMMTLGNAM